MSSIAKFGTVAFEPDIMRQLIGFGEIQHVGPNEYRLVKELNPGKLNLALWFNIVPNPYKAEVEKMALEVWKHFENTLAKTETLEVFIYELLSKIHRQLQYQPPEGHCGGG